MIAATTTTAPDSSTSTPATILRYWRAVEILTPQPLKTPRDARREEPIVAWQPGAPLPWHPDHPLQALRPSKLSTEWRYFVYLGIYDLADAQTHLEHHFGKAPDDVGEPTSGQGCLAAFLVTAAGRPILDSYTLSSAAWAMGRLAALGPHAPNVFDGFDQALAKEREDFASRRALDADGPPGHNGAGAPTVQPTAEAPAPASAPVAPEERPNPPLTAVALERELAHVRHHLGWPDPSRPLRAIAYIRSTRVAKSRQGATDGFDFLNSFFLADLDRFATSLTQNRAGQALRSYLADPTTVAATPRVDLRTDLAEVHRWLAPNRFPQGRWPSPGHHPLVLSQQLAVNLAIGQLAPEAGVLGVNGPPGTGKTTLLRDLIAAIVVQRAHALATLPTLAAAFGAEVGRWRTGTAQRIVRALAANLHGHEIVVASSNNGAVENVTRQIPAATAIDPSWQPRADYFADVAQAIIGQPAWALLAAPLGNKQNRSHFRTHFWFGVPTPDAASQAIPPAAPPGALPSAKDSPGFMNILRAAAAPPATAWPEAVRRFQDAAATVDRLTTARQAAADALAALPRLAAAQAPAQTRIQEAQVHLATAQDLVAQRQADLDLATHHHQTITDQLAALHQAKPGLLAILLSWGREFRQWSAEARTRRRDRDEAYTHLRAAQAALAQAQAHRTAADQDLAATLTALRGIQTATDAAHQAIAAFRRDTDAILPDRAFWARPPHEIETLSPWIDDAWNRARAQLFVEALHLHRAWILGAAASVRGNLAAAMDILDGRLPHAISHAAARAAWTTLFMVVPVVSTTFASFDRLFAHLKEQDLGWLLIDEAGQAVPQAAVGALGRSRRAVVVGDPRQLEPVVTVPPSTVIALRRHFAVADLWQPNALSAQALADRVSRHGTDLADDDGESTWIGTPLRVHRRCDDPMFSTANRIAYRGLMVYATPSSQDLRDWPESAWLDIRATTCEGNWVPDEGEAALHLLRSLPSQDPAALLACLTPFRHVVHGLRSLLGAPYRGLHIGTIHTYQGKEKPAILLVLGGNLNAEGALNWAAIKPNLLNVALTRAQRRLYVIGNRDRWRTRPYFRDLAQALPLVRNANHPRLVRP
jgi:AAA domain